ncbi:MAG: Helix-turn-helix domain protein [Syntrophorhabdaceae bacterium PtaU1.Bin034]|nr:MAG: Helix-turn-helix domain protein [Syntrophorhabdaceae bacterium PtaU1.Bin034]
MGDIDLIPLKQAQEILKVSNVTLWKWVKAGKISVVKLSPKKVYIRREELERFIRESER